GFATFSFNGAVVAFSNNFLIGRYTPAIQPSSLTQAFVYFCTNSFQPSSVNLTGWSLLQTNIVVGATNGGNIVFNNLLPGLTNAFDLAGTALNATNNPSLVRTNTLYGLTNQITSITNPLQGGAYNNGAGMTNVTGTNTIIAGTISSNSLDPGTKAQLFSVGGGSGIATNNGSGTNLFLTSTTETNSLLQNPTIFYNRALLFTNPAGSENAVIIGPSNYYAGD